MVKIKNFLLWNLLAIALTYLLVVSGFDWWYFLATRSLVPYMLPAAAIGFFVPIILPLWIMASGAIKKNYHRLWLGWAVGLAALSGMLVSFIYKAFTGRAHPVMFGNGALTDITREFHFGFLQGGVFWGWPSSHTAVAFALAAAVWILLPKNKPAKFLAALYAIYVGIAVSMTIHWFSDFVAGAIIGTVVGIVVGKYYLRKLRVLTK